MQRALSVIGLFLVVSLLVSESRGQAEELPTPRLPRDKLLVYRGPLGALRELARARVGVEQDLKRLVEGVLRRGVGRLCFGRARGRQGEQHSHKDEPEPDHSQR